MATSGQYTYSINRDDLISSAFRVLGVFNDDSPAPPSDVRNAAQALNIMIKQWMSEGYPLWTVDTVAFPLVANQLVYSIGPGGDVNTYRPLRVVEGRITYQNGNYDVPLNELSRQDYDQLSGKGNQGTVNSYYYDPQLLRGNLYVFSPSDTTPITIKLTVQRPLMDMASPTDSFDFPVECLNAIKFGLANEMLSEYEVPEEKAIRIERRSMMLKESMFDSSQEDASVMFSPNTWQ